MRDGTKFSTWKDLAWAIMDELDGLHESNRDLQNKYDKLHDEFVIFKTTVYVTAGIISAITLAIFGIFEFAVN